MRAGSGRMLNDGIPPSPESKTPALLLSHPPVWRGLQDGRAGLEKARHGNFDLAISDGNTHGMDGLAMLRRMRAGRALCRLSRHLTAISWLPPQPRDGEVPSIRLPLHGAQHVRESTNVRALPVLRARCSCGELVDDGIAPHTFQRR
jgi:hypothetical protein